MVAAYRFASARLKWLVVSATVAACGSLMTIGADSRWLAALGDAILRTKHVPNTVPYAAEASSGWHNVPALGELVFAGLERGLGDPGLILAQVLAVAIALTVVSREMPAEGGIVLLLVPLAALDAFLVVRAQVFSLALFPVLVLLLRRESEAPSKRIWLLVPLFALWTNLHGGVLIGAAVAAAYLLLGRFRRDPWTTAMVLLASAAALFANPAGLETPAYYQHVFDNVWRTSHQGLWAAPSVRHPIDVAFLACTPVVAFLAIRTRLRAWEYVAASGLAFAAFTAARNEVWLVLFLAPAAARRLRELPVPRRPIRLALTLLAIGTPAALFALGMSGHHTNRYGANAALRREAIVAARGTPILAEPYDAEQLALEGAKIVIGNPIDAFARSDQLLYLRWTQGSGAAVDRLAQHSRAILVLRRDPAQQRLARDTDFCRAAADARAVLYVRCGNPLS